MAEASPPSILAVLSSDFGELANALYLLDGTWARAHLLLPPRLYEQNRDVAPHDVSTYRQAADVLAGLRQRTPKLLLLMSGYLFGVNALMTVNELAEIVRESRTMGIPLATTDPFLGVLSGVSEETFVHPQRAAMARHFAEVEKLLHGVTHLYLSPMPASPSSATFYNSRLLLSPEKKSIRLHWLFVLSLEDYIAQCSVLGRSVFDEMLLRMMSDTIVEGRRPVVLAPRVANESLAGRIPEGGTLLNFCNRETFRSWQLTAEHVFYWNIFSNSVLARVANGGPVFFLDSGHLARSIPSMVSIAMRSYYANATLPMLDPRARLSVTELAQRSQIQRETFAPALAGFRLLPSPDEMISSLLSKKDR